MKPLHNCSSMFVRIKLNLHDAGMGSSAQEGPVCKGLKRCVLHWEISTMRALFLNPCKVYGH